MEVSTPKIHAFRLLRGNPSRRRASSKSHILVHSLLCFVEIDRSGNAPPRRCSTLFTAPLRVVVAAAAACFAARAAGAESSQPGRCVVVALSRLIAPLRAASFALLLDRVRRPSIGAEFEPPHKPAGARSRSPAADRSSGGVRAFTSPRAAIRGLQSR
ncbi:hypothetical protein Scep_019829 [Stephania cephalantha]|uniref:Uncharacterized protein n=1 Tax=Stephania cephalantha TaxID=152367 RepID=A0AAP0IBN1_9MAGN